MLSIQFSAGVLYGEWRDVFVRHMRSLGQTTRVQIMNAIVEKEQFVGNSGYGPADVQRGDLAVRDHHVGASIDNLRSRESACAKDTEMWNSQDRSVYFFNLGFECRRRNRSFPW
jgi:hypothetical protein